MAFSTSSSASHRPGITLLLVVVVFAVAMAFVQVDAIPISAAKLQALKRSVSQAQHITTRQKRYTDYQERASAFCTGICMYEERKSYSDCFDICNYYY